MEQSRSTLALALLVGVFSFESAVGGESGPVKWRTDFVQAAIEAQNSGKLLVISVHASWCGPCQQMQRTTFHDPRLAEVLNNDCIPLSIDADAHTDLTRQWGVQSLPTQLLIQPSGPQRGKVLQRLEGKRGAADYVAAVRSALQLTAPARPSTMADANVRPVGATRRPATRDMEPIRPPAPEDDPIEVRAAALPQAAPAPPALGGRCPVSMIEEAVLTVGKSSESIVHQGKRYCFASAEHRLKFEANPKKYLPGADGDCVVSMYDEGKSVQGNLRYPALFANRVYFLSDEEHRRRFLSDPEKYVEADGRPKAKSRR